MTTPFTPEQAAARMNEQARGTHIGETGVEFVAISPERGVARLAFRPAVTQVTGLFNAGALITLADACATATCMSMSDPSMAVDPSRFPLAIQISVNLIRNTNRGVVTAESVPLHRGRTTQVVETKVRDEEGRILISATTTHLVLGGSR